MECVRRLIPAALARGLAKSAGRGELKFGPVTVARLPTPLPGVQSFAIEKQRLLGVMYARAKARGL
jgi:hypothetical protein